ncbi:MAG: hypothetical protein ABID54_00340 [Pseudomonadota bacterium]
MADELEGKQIFLEMDVRLFPQLWWMLLRETVNDYMQFDEGHGRHRQAADWLFMEEEERKMREDVISFYLVSKAFNIHRDKFRFLLQRLKDKGREEQERDPRGRKTGYLHDSSIEELIRLSQIRDDGDLDLP